jgi:hypothetical protein
MWKVCSLVASVCICVLLSDCEQKHIRIATGLLPGEFELRDALFEFPTNVAMVYNSVGELIMAFYIYEDCTRLSSFI